MDVAISFLNTYPLDSDLFSGLRSPTFEQRGPGQKAEILDSAHHRTDALYISFVKSNLAHNE